jgi:hypothetical protein
MKTDQQIFDLSARDLDDEIARTADHKRAATQRTHRASLGEYLMRLMAEQRRRRAVRNTR